MKRLISSARYRLILSHVPHAHELLDALNVNAELQVLNVTLHRSGTGLLHCGIDVKGLEPIIAEQWAVAHSDDSFLTVQSGIRDGRAGTLWFGHIRFDSPPQVYLRMELPMIKPRRRLEEIAHITLSIGSDSSVLESWGEEERDRLAQTAVERMVWPLLQRAEHIGYDSFAHGLRTAMERLGTLRAEEVLATTAQVMMSGWVTALTRSIALSAPQLARIKAVLSKDTRRADWQDPRPVFSLIHLISASGENLAVAPYQDSAYWAEAPQAPIFSIMRSVTGTHFESPASLIEFLRSLSTLLLLQYRANGSTDIDLANPSKAEPMHEAKSPDF